MAKRFTDTEKWKDPWFRKLSAESKVLFNYFCDDCDLAGFLQQDDDAFCFLTGIPREKINDCYLELLKSITVKDGWIWVKNFLRHQKNLPLNPQNNAHKHIIGILNIQVSRFGFDVLEEKIGALKGLLSPLGIGNGKGKVKEGIVKGGRFSPPSLDEVKAAFSEKGFASSEAQKFLAYFESVGWVIGQSKKPMKSWRGAVATWCGKLMDSGVRPKVPQRQEEKPKQPEVVLSNEERERLIQEAIPGFRRKVPV